MRLDPAGNPVVVDGFLLSASQLYLPVNYRANALAQMEILRLARGYRTRWYNVPEDSQDPIPAYSQVEYQVSTWPGSYIWGYQYWQETLDSPNDTALTHIQITDSCTETQLFSDYVQGGNIEDSVSAPPYNRKHPMMIMPRLVGDPALLNVEIYNGASVPRMVQLLVLMAEPIVPTEEMREAIIDAGLAHIL